MLTFHLQSHESTEAARTSWHARECGNGTVDVRTVVDGAKDNAVPKRCSFRSRAYDAKSRMHRYFRQVRKWRSLTTNGSIDLLSNAHAAILLERFEL